MKPTPIPSLTIALLFAALNSHAQVVSIVSESNAVFRVEAYQAAELLSLSPIYPNTQLVIEKDGIKVSHFYNTVLVLPLTVAGPATIKVNGGPGPYATLATFRLTPEPYPPDRSILVAPGPGGAVITLECSTNLVNWTSTTNGIYTNLPVAKFFRIREDRIRGE